MGPAVGRRMPGILGWAAWPRRAAVSGMVVVGEPISPSARRAIVPEWRPRGAGRQQWHQWLQRKQRGPNGTIGDIGGDPRPPRPMVEGLVDLAHEDGPPSGPPRLKAFSLPDRGRHGVSACLPRALPRIVVHRVRRSRSPTARWAQSDRGGARSTLAFLTPLQASRETSPSATMARAAAPTRIAASARAPSTPATMLAADHE